MAVLFSLGKCVMVHFAKGEEEREVVDGGMLSHGKGSTSEGCGFEPGLCVGRDERLLL